METSIQSFIQTNSGKKIVHLFGYSSRGLPGLEIHGLKSQGKLIREKIIYLTKKVSLKPPLLRYSLALDQENIDSKVSFENLEIPLLLMYWHLAGLIPLGKLDDCLVAGRFNTKGHFLFLPFENKTSYLPIGIGESLEASMLLENIPQLSFKKVA